MAQGQAAWPGAPDKPCRCLSSWGGQLQAGTHLGSKGCRAEKGPQALQRSWAGTRSQLRVQRWVEKVKGSPGEGMTLAQGVPGL